MNKVISFFLSVVSLFTSFFGISVKDPVLPAPTGDFIPAVRFLVCSDTHVTENYEESERAGRIVRMFDIAYDFAGQDSNYGRLDAAMFVGDCTDNGTDKEFEILANEINTGKRDGTQILAIAANNHDGYIGPSSLDSISKISGLDPDFHIVINGFHFIGISASENENLRYTPDQRIWLREQLEEASSDNPDKPVFVCNHEHPFATVYGSDVWSTVYFSDILSMYPQVVHFSGHSHYPLNDPRSIIQGSFTAVGTGAMSYTELKYKGVTKLSPSDCGECAQAWIAEADSGNNVRLTGIDVNTGKVLCQYVIPAVCKRNERVFTAANMKALSSAPEFADEAKLDVKDNNDGTYTVTAPAAESTDGFIVFVYRIRVFSKSGIQTYTEISGNDYYLSDCYTEISFTVKAEPGYRVEVTAENAYYMASEPVSAVI